MAENRKQLNEQWCEFHWAPYRDPKANGVIGAMSLMQALLNHEKFMERVARKRKVYGWSKEEAAQAAMEDWVRKERKPICCLLGDETMDRILKTAGGSPASASERP